MPTLASGAPRPGSWMMSVTTPLMYPFLSAESSVRCRAGPFRVLVWETNTLPRPLRWERITRPICRQRGKLSTAGFLWHVRQHASLHDGPNLQNILCHGLRFIRCHLHLITTGEQGHQHKQRLRQPPQSGLLPARLCPMEKLLAAHLDGPLSVPVLLC